MMLVTVFNTSKTVLLDMMESLHKSLEKEPELGAFKSLFNRLTGEKSTA